MPFQENVLNDLLTYKARNFSKSIIWKVEDHLMIAHEVTNMACVGIFLKVKMLMWNNYSMSGEYKCKSVGRIAYFVSAMWLCLPGPRRGCSTIGGMERCFVWLALMFVYCIYSYPVVPSWYQCIVAEDIFYISERFFSWKLHLWMWHLFDVMKK